MGLPPDETSLHLGNIRANAHIPQHDHNDQLTQIQQLFSKGKAALAADQFEDAQQTLAQLYTYIHDNLLPSCLMLRAYAYQRQHAYIEGATLADQYIGQKKQDADGYLLASNMRLLTGDLDTALRTYRTGAQHSSHDHPRYSELVSRRDQMERQVSRRNTRLIRTLPPEVIYRTLSFLGWSDLVTLAITCRAWHKLVIDWPDMWREITIYRMDDLRIGCGLQQFLTRAPPQHVRKLTFTVDDSIWRAAAYEEITRYNWNHIEELDIYCYGDETDAHDYMQRSDTPVSIIRNCKDTLKRLRLIYDHGRVLNYTLENCPNLECLIYEDYQYSDEDLDILEDESDPLPPGPFRLRQLCIQCESTNMDIEALVSKCPDLESFRLVYDDRDLEDDFDGILHTLHNDCPWLRTVHIKSGSGGSAGWWIPSRRKQQHADNRTQGLRDLMFNSNPEHVLEELGAMIRSSQHSLEELNVDDNFRAAALYDILAATQMDNLRVLRCAPLIATESSTLLEAIIDGSPRLQTVHIPSGAASDAVLMALGRLSSLTDLTFRVDEHMHRAGLDALFLHTPSLDCVNVGLSLQHPRIGLCDLIRAIAGCRPLQRLKIQAADGWANISDMDLQDLANYIGSQQSVLREVTIFSQLHQNVILFWSNFKRLQHLVFVNTTFVPTVWAEVERMIAQMSIPHLKIRVKQSNDTACYQLDSSGNYNGDATVNETSQELF